jgi:hypothetical protein
MEPLNDDALLFLHGTLLVTTIFAKRFELMTNEAYSVPGDAKIKILCLLVTRDEMACKAARQYLRDFEKENPKRAGSSIRDNASARRSIRFRPKSTVLLRRKAFTLDNSLPASDLLQSIQKLTNIVYLTRLDAGDKVKMRNYMTEADTELTRLKDFVMKIAPPNSSQQIN